MPRRPAVIRNVHATDCGIAVAVMGFPEIVVEDSSAVNTEIFLATHHVEKVQTRRVTHHAGPKD